MRLGPTQIMSIATLCLAAAVLGFLWGRASLPPSETEIITEYAARYVAETGGAPTDCLARPGPQGAAWITIYCEGEAGRFAYPVDRAGNLVSVEGGGT